MKRFIVFLCVVVCTGFAYGQELKPCGTSKIHLRNHGDRSMIARSERITQSVPMITRASSVSHFTGEKKGLIILVEFPDIPFTSENPFQTWTDIANKNGYSENGAPGSVSDYFYDQSYGQFKLTFDVAGPVLAAQNHDYYGQNIDWGDSTGYFDQNVGKLVEEACKGVADKVQFADYDWNGDGVVEQVFLLYAGHGENDYWDRDSTVIWPHMATLSIDWPGYEEGLVIQDMLIDTYACSNEINRSNTLAGMGTFCHEFSHCLGLPDLYNTEEGYSVVGRYDLMDQGSYNGNNWCPVGYSSYERYSCGWLEPKATDAPMTLVAAVSDQPQSAIRHEVRPLHQYPDAYIYRLSEDATDYYLIEHREKASWDKFIPKAGLLVWHIDYDEEAWTNNEVNNDPEHLRVEHMTIGDIPTAISGIATEGKRIVGYYDLQGNKLTSPRPPFVIVRYNDGTTKKIAQ